MIYWQWLVIGIIPCCLQNYLFYSFCLWVFELWEQNRRSTMLSTHNILCLQHPLAIVTSNYFDKKTKASSLLADCSFFFIIHTALWNSVNWTRFYYSLEIFVFVINVFVDSLALCSWISNTSTLRRFLVFRVLLA